MANSIILLLTGLVAILTFSDQAPVDPGQPPIPQELVCGTTSGNGQPCVFPFVYEGKQHTKCAPTKTYSDYFWCATSVNSAGEYDRTSTMGYCNSAQTECLPEPIVTEKPKEECTGFWKFLCKIKQIKIKELVTSIKERVKGVMQTVINKVSAYGFKLAGYGGNK